MRRKPLTQKQLSETLLWFNFPGVIQERLFQHYQRFQHGSLHRAKADVQRCTHTLFELTLENPLDQLLKAHCRYYGQASNDDLTAIVQAFTQIRQYRATKQ